LHLPDVTIYAHGVPPPVPPQTRKYVYLRGSILARPITNFDRAGISAAAAPYGKGLDIGAKI
jgi:hypothetical protein